MAGAGGAGAGGAPGPAKPGGPKQQDPPLGPRRPFDPALKDLPRGYGAKQMHALKHEFKHAHNFGVAQRRVPDPKKPGKEIVLTPNKAESDAFRAAIEAHVAAPATRSFRGSYKGDDVVVHLDEATQNVVWFGLNGEFWGAKRIADLRMVKVLSTGVIAT